MNYTRVEFEFEARSIIPRFASIRKHLTRFPNPIAAESDDQCEKSNRAEIDYYGS